MQDAVVGGQTAVGAKPKNVLFFDLETTSADSETCGVVQLGFQMVRYDGTAEFGVVAEMPEPVSALLNPGVRIEPEASDAHHYVDSDVAGSPSALDSPCVELFRELVARADYSCGHNAEKFDVPIAARVLAPRLAGVPVLDTLAMARKQWQVLPSHKLGCLCYRFGLYDGVPRSERVLAHDAAADVESCRKLFELMAKSQALSMDALFEWSRRVVPSEVFTFGRHKGEKIASVVADDPSFVQWCLKQEWFHTDYPADHAGVVAALKEAEKA